LASWGLTKGTGYVGQTTRDKLNSLLETDGEEPADGEEPVITGDGLTVALASDNPGATTIVADSTGAADSAQSMIPFLKVKLTNGDSSAVKVTQISFKRSGISSDTDTSQAYLYEGDTLLAEYNSFSSAVLTFSSSAGLVTIPAGSSKTVTLKGDLVNNASSGKTIRFSIDSASDVVSDASAVSGSFGLVGNYMSTAVTTDVGQLTVSTTTAAGATVDPQDGLEVYNLNLAGADQKLEVRKIKFSNIGSTAAGDLKNFVLYDGGAQIGDTIEDMDADKTITFDLTDSPLVIDKGITKNLHLRGDIVSGTNRTFQFSIQEMTDITVYDTGYGIYVKPNKADSWTVFKMVASTIDTGKLVLTKSSDCPSGNVALGATNVTIAKFDAKATGEDVKIASLYVSVYGTNMEVAGNDGLYQGKVYFDGSQKDTTRNLLTSSADNSTSTTQFTFGNTFIVPADGETYTIEIKADIKDDEGETFGGDEVITTKLKTFVATGRDSSADVTVSSATGYALSITTGILSSAINQAVSNWTEANPTGVGGVTEALVGSFVVTAGASEGADITSVVMQFSTTTTFLQNMKLYNGTKETGTQIGATRSSVAIETDYTFYPSPYISLAKSSSFVLNVYADILTDIASAGANGFVQLGVVSGTGKVTNASANTTAGETDGQTIWIVASANLTAVAASDQPISAQVMMSDTGVVFNKIKLTAGAGEKVQVTEIIVTAGIEGVAPTSSVKNISLWDGTTQVGSTKNALVHAGTATFDLTSSPWEIPASSDKTLTIKADINSYAYASSGAGVKLGVITSGITAKGAVSGVDCSNTGEVLGTVMYNYKTKLTVALTAGSPEGAAIGGSGKHVIYIDVKNDGAYDAYATSAAFTISYDAGTSGEATSSGLRVYSLYDKIDLTSALSTTSIAVGGNPATSTLTLASIGSGTYGYAIPAGTTKTFYLVGDTGFCASGTSGSRLQFYVNASADFIWSDGITLSITALNKTFPLYGGTLTY